MCTEEFIRMMFTVDLYGNRGLDSCTIFLVFKRPKIQNDEYVFVCLYMYLKWHIFL